MLFTRTSKAKKINMWLVFEAERAIGLFELVWLLTATMASTATVNNAQITMLCIGKSPELTAKSVWGWLLGQVLKITFLSSVFFYLHQSL